MSEFRANAEQFESQKVLNLYRHGELTSFSRDEDHRSRIAELTIRFLEEQKLLLLEARDFRGNQSIVVFRKVE